MRQVYEQPEEANKKAKRAAADIRSMHSPAAVAEVVKARLDEIQSLLPVFTGSKIVQQETPSLPLGPVSIPPSLPLEIITKSKWATASRFGKLGRLAKKIMVRLIRVYAIHQDNMNRYLLASNQLVRQQTQFLWEQAQVLREQGQRQQTQVNGLDTQIEYLEEQTLQQQTQIVALRERVEALKTETRKEAVETREEANELLQKLGNLGMRFAIRPHMQMPIFSSNGYSGKHSLGYESSSVKPHEQFDYLGFEEVFRGAESFIKERQSVYLRFFTDKNLVLDIGCGRGEFLELLAEAGIKVIGIDNNPDMAGHCAKKGLTNVVLQDCNQYLSSSYENNVDGIFSAQFIEHLPFDELYKFLTLSREKLSPGGIFIAETVNPHCIEAMKTFYVDLTHVKPLFPEVILFLCRSAGFSKAEIFYPSGYGFSEEQYWLQGEYAVIAWK
jgi:O-antigen chain-terminating methyltransferase